MRKTISQGFLRRIICFVFFPLVVLGILIARSGIEGIPGFTFFAGSSSLTPDQKPNPLYKFPPTEPPPPPITDNFPLAATAKSSSDLPSIPPWNIPPKPRINESTPLFIGFTRNWRLLQQTVISYLTAGWPAEDIYVVENTGVMHSNRDGKLTLQNPFYLDHHRLTKIFGVNVLHTPTLFTFAQLQNFYLFTSLERGWEHYFWAHMDTIAVSDEEIPVTADQPYKSIYTRAVELMQETLDPSWGPLAMRWYAYDRLSLVRAQALVDVGGWDTQIPFYMTDCDMHERLWMHDKKIDDVVAGKIWDVASSLDDLAVLYKRGDVDSSTPNPLKRSETAAKDTKTQGIAARRREEEEDDDAVKKDIRSLRAPLPDDSTSLASPAYHSLLQQLDDLQNFKSNNPLGRNTWQARQRGGESEPFYRDPQGFEEAIHMWMDFGTKVFQAKWGRGLCDLRDSGLKRGDEWKMWPEWEEKGPRRNWWMERIEWVKRMTEVGRKDEVGEFEKLNDAVT